MPATLATPDDVRTAGGLLSESKGGATDSQITASLKEAQRHLMSLVTRTVYLMVAGYTGSSSDDEKAKKEAFTDAEARFAIAFLPVILTNAQLQETGYKLEASIGKATTKFGNADDISLISDFWVSEAMIILSKYLGTSYYDQLTGDEYGFESDDGSLTLLSI
jgi:hypothetical protein